MAKLIQLSDLNISNFIELLRDSELIIYENIQGSKLYFSYDGEQFIIRPRSMDANPINKVDLALQKYYEPVYTYLNSLEDRIRKLIPKNYTFFCNYFSDTKPSGLNYDKLPDNKLILTSIIKDKKISFNVDEIFEFSELLNITPLPIIFKGKLVNKQLDLITYFLNTSSEDLNFIFGEENFASFFYKILNPDIKSSLLSDDFKTNVDKLIIKIDNNQEISFSILNPIYKAEDKVKSEFKDVYSILLLDFVTFCQILKFETVRLKAIESDMMYLELISAMFNSYCHENSSKIENYDFMIPQFMHDDKFKINLDLVKNPKTHELLKKSDKLEYLFKIILSSFRMPKKDEFGVFTKNTIKLFNEIVWTVRNIIDKKLKIERENKLDDLLNFDVFYNIEYGKDGIGQVYPDLGNFDNVSVMNKKNPIKSK